jgi:hypothetical protein
MRKRIFHLTKHAEENLIKRDMPHPNDLGLTQANKKTKKLIRESCPNEGFRSDYVYWSVRDNKIRYVYVCAIKDIAEYIVITCFKYEESKQLK